MVLFSFPVTEGNAYKKMESQLSPIPTLKGNMSQTIKLKTQFFRHLHLKLKSTCTASKCKPKMNNRVSSALGQ